LVARIREDECALGRMIGECPDLAKVCSIPGMGPIFGYCRGERDR
jgi:hypothetical protein